MPKNTQRSKTVPVKEHPRKVPVSKKNPNGITIVDYHLRHIDGQYLDLKMIQNTFDSYDKKNLIYPTKGKLPHLRSDNFDDYIAVWSDYFSKKLNLKTPLDPNMLKALIASESSFNPLAKNKTALGLTQITKDTLKIIQDLNGEVKDFVFKDIRQKDLKNPNVSVAMATRWLAYKQNYANKILKRNPTSDEIIQLYKGILNDKSAAAKIQMDSYRKNYAKIKN